MYIVRFEDGTAQEYRWSEDAERTVRRHANKWALQVTQFYYEIR